MKEDFLHYVWQYQIWSNRVFTTTTGKQLLVEHVGSINTDAGPDFFNASLKIDGQKWAGNVELHLRSSDWYAHKHHQDKTYNSVILHVVWEHDVEVFREDETSIPTLEIKANVPKELIASYTQLKEAPVSWIACQEQLPRVVKFTTDAWLERMFLERLEDKANELLLDAKQNKYHWEELLFWKLARNFGLKVNADAFYQMAISIPFYVVQRCKSNRMQLEALFIGQARLLEADIKDVYYQQLQNEYAFLKSKFSLQPIETPPKFHRLRPINFPGIRLSQLAGFYHSHTSLFSNWMGFKSLAGFYTSYRIKASAYWDSHYSFGVNSPKLSKRLSKDFMNLLLINTLVPMRFVYNKYLGVDNSYEIMQLIAQLPPESNAIVANYKKHGLKANSALQAQALIQLYHKYCTPKRCLSCAIGNSILRKTLK